MANADVAEALGLAPGSSVDQIARHFRARLGLPPEATTDAAMWVHFLRSVERARVYRSDGPRGDKAELANNVVEDAIVPNDEPDGNRFGMKAWDRELGVGFAEADEALRRFVFEEIAPRLARAGLFTLL